MGTLERIASIELEMSRTQKHKGSEHHLGLLKARLAKLRSQLLEPTSKSSKEGEGFHVKMSGDARVCIVGFPSVGKSTMLSRLTRTQSTASAAEFTTLTAIPGNLYYKDARIQLIDTPGIIEGAAQGKGKGRQVISIARTANLLIIMLDPTREVAQKKIIEHELNFYGIRTNTVPPDITINKKSTGVNINSTVPLTHMTHDLAKLVLHEYKIYNADVLFRCDATVDEFIDVIEGKRVYIPCIYLYNKIDRITLGEVEKFASRPHTVTISCELDLNIPYFVECIWQYLKMIRLYTKRKGRGAIS
ncbi:uncharacterized GTP-binding protein C02F5.3-like isoform X2 [Schistocerca gregaria]|uniref:uncharacterized GTP-binding protein C02F5.3-like isoform X2 n=1 Tax=Schistocerca gregaria TaxID=7010 RepID=UPI00211E36E8|nr:uncharacterized GTP-binding protein C02F5.3-like isoform X2 [Schistocerca gregaria]